MADERAHTAASTEHPLRAAIWSVIRRTFFWGPVCGAVIAVAASIASDPLAVVLFPGYVIGGGVVGLLGSTLGIAVALAAWVLLRTGGVGVRRRAIASAAAAAVTVPAAWAGTLLLSLDPEGAAAPILWLIAVVTVASVVLTTLLCRRFLHIVRVAA